MERNKFSKELIHSQLETDELCHMTPEEKKAYNAEYYKRNKEKFWGVKGGRPMARPKWVAEDMIVEGKKPEVHRRGNGLGTYLTTGPAGSYKKRPNSGPSSTNPNFSLSSQLQYAQQHNFGQTLSNQVNQAKEYLGEYAQAAKNAVKKAVKDKVNTAASDWKTGAKAVSQLAADSVARGKKIASAILSKFMR